MKWERVGEAVGLAFRFILSRSLNLFFLSCLFYLDKLLRAGQNGPRVLFSLTKLCILSIFPSSELVRNPELL